jgi:hypothetical protein
MVGKIRVKANRELDFIRWLEREKFRIGFLHYHYLTPKAKYAYWVKLEITS